MCVERRVEVALQASFRVGFNDLLLRDLKPEAEQRAERERERSARAWRRHISREREREIDPVKKVRFEI